MVLTRTRTRTYEREEQPVALRKIRLTNRERTPNEITSNRLRVSLAKYKRLSKSKVDDFAKEMIGIDELRYMNTDVLAIALIFLDSYQKVVSNEYTVEPQYFASGNLTPIINEIIGIIKTPDELTRLKANILKYMSKIITHRNQLLQLYIQESVAAPIPT